MAYRPIYVLVGPEVPNVKFQFSTKVPLLFPGGPDAPDPVFSNLYFGYTQVSLWDIHEPGAATIDTTYEPELFFATQTPPPPVDFQGFKASGVGLQAGVQHESNGRSGDGSRNANYFYLRPTLFFGNRQAVHGELAVTGRVFFSTLRGNPDVEDYYGHAELFGAVRFGDALHVTAAGRLGDHPGRGAVQLDVTYPLRSLRVDAYLHLQYFNGYTESLLDYREHHQAVRLGVSLVR
jgi:outer membrane phospholipase A